MSEAAMVERRRRPGAEKRAEAILAEALRLFAARHHTTVTMREIARSCGINQALIYYYFESKEHLLHRALGYAIQTLTADYDGRVTDDLDPVAALSEVIAVNAEHAPLLQLFVKVMSDYAATQTGDVAIDDTINEFYRQEQAVLERVLRRGVDVGVFRPLEVATAARFIGLHLDGIFHASASRRDGRVLADLADLDRLLKDYLIRG